MTRWALRQLCRWEMTSAHVGRDLGLVCMHLRPQAQHGIAGWLVYNCGHSATAEWQKQDLHMAFLDFGVSRLCLHAPAGQVQPGCWAKK